MANNLKQFLDDHVGYLIGVGFESIHESKVEKFITTSLIGEMCLLTFRMYPDLRYMEISRGLTDAEKQYIRERCGDNYPVIGGGK